MHAVGSLRGMNHMTNSEYQFLSGLDKSNNDIHLYM